MLDKVAVNILDPSVAERNITQCTIAIFDVLARAG